LEQIQRKRLEAVRPWSLAITRWRLAVSVGVIAMGAAGQAAARTCTWSGGTSTSFSTSTNWSCTSGFGPPGALDTAQFSGTPTRACTVDVTTTLTSLTLLSTFTSTVTLGAGLTVSGALSIAAGTLATSASNLQVGGDLSITSGTFTGGSGTVTITGNLTMTGGTYTGGAGTATVGGTVSINNSITNGTDPTLVGYWKLDETASPAADSSGQGNPLTWSGSPTFSTSVPSSITFTDTGSLAMTGAQYAASSVLTGVPELRPTTVTVSAWYKATSVDSSGAEIVSGSNTYGLRITSTGAMVMKRISDNTAAADWIEYRVSVPTALDGKWHQIVGQIVTGTGGSMSVYVDGVITTGNYWVNGSNGPLQLSNSTTPTAATAASSAIDWNANTESFGLIVGNNPSTTGYQFGKGCAAGACAIDEVRVYNRALTPGEIAALSHGNQPGGATGVLSLSKTMSVTGSVTVQSTGTLTLSSGSTLAVGSALTVDGTLNATSATIQALSARYAFTVGSVAAAAAVLNIDGLSVSGMDSNGMWINANTGAVTTFTMFDNVAFSNGTGTQLLQIYATSLFLNANGCTFDGSATYAVKLTGNGTGSGAGPRAMFGNATCATNDATTGLCATAWKSDDDADNNGVADHPTTNGAVVQFIRGAESDTDGTFVGFPTPAFDWNTFTYYSTYATFHDASTGSDVIYVRDEAGNPLYSWTNPTADETITGTPQWITVSNKHYLYVAVNGGSINTGKVYRLVDTGTKTTSGTLTLDTTWATSGAYSCTCTITSNISLDANNLYAAATAGTTTQELIGVNQSTGVKITSWPVTAPANVTTSSPMLWKQAGITKLYLGVTGSLLELTVTGTTWAEDTSPGTITGRVSGGTSSLAATFGTARLYAGDSSGTLWAITPAFATGPAPSSLWSYAAGSAITDNTYDSGTDTVQFGTAGGKVVVLNAGTGALLNTPAYPYTLDASDPITAAPLYYAGVLAVGTTKGKLYLLDRNTGTGVSIIKEFNFGSSQSVSTVAFDADVSRYMVATSSAANDGRVYYIDFVSDPTPSSL
jgi:fibronectin-binding autotransporter adhesin